MESAGLENVTIVRGDADDIDRLEAIARVEPVDRFTVCRDHCLRVGIVGQVMSGLPAFELNADLLEACGDGCKIGTGLA